VVVTAADPKPAWQNPPLTKQAGFLLPNFLSLSFYRHTYSLETTPSEAQPDQVVGQQE
jgi:hypothetical protein